MLHIAICDDEPTAVSIIENLLRAGASYDLLFLDVDMPELDGIALGRELSESLRDTLLIYISGQTERVFDSFRARPFRFLPKSSLGEMWSAAMDDTEEELRCRRASRLVFASGSQSLSLRPEHIVYIEALLKKQMLHTTGGNYDIAVGFESAVSRLEGTGFIRIHRSYAVNYRFIRSVPSYQSAICSTTFKPNP